MIKWEKALLDADFSFKLGQLTNINVIEDYVGELVGTIYMHRHIYEREILTPHSLKKQIDRLIEKGKAEIVDLSTLSSPLEKSLYHEMVTLLKAADSETKEDGKNWGETVSLAYAKVSGIPYFLSDERSLQEIADEYLNTDVENSITIIRLKDFILALKDLGYKRKECQMIWLVANFDPLRKEQSREWAKKVFNDELWPIE
ncbi:hypothetical protein [Exiguobacterium aurantiacum]|uniref:hypothetical protein n=1 Tax=Exiguobacterium aurantiacum TaxID=33987 RepID=UPI00384DAA87